VYVWYLGASNSSRNSLRSGDHFVPRRLAESQQRVSNAELCALSVRKVSGTATGTGAVDIPHERGIAHGNSPK
jgi:hypothetical protein